MIVATEKNPKLSAVIAENPIAKIFLIFNCLINDTTDSNATIRNMIAKTIFNTTSLCAC